jgi:multicomponent Na+:H+ antiporter subunit D
MTIFPVFFAVIENDLRKVLAYSLNNQLGFMVVGIGIGTELALNGTVSHAFAHILYKALLFMSMGAILQQVGTIKASELGGLYKSMPYTTVFCIIGAAAISAFPLFSGFVTKSMVMSAAAHDGYVLTSLALLFASAGVLHHSGIRIPYHGFFGHDRGLRCKEAPLNMLIAMGITAALCIGIGVFPQVLYQWLPYPVDYHPYSGHHVLAQMQLLFFALLSFAILKRRDLEPPDLRSVVLDFDWFYRKLAPRVLAVTVLPALRVAERAQSKFERTVSFVLYGPVDDDGRGRVPPALQGNTVFLIAVLALLVYLLVDFWRATA